MIKWSTSDGQTGLLERFELEEAYILHGNLALRSDRSLTLVEEHEGMLIAAGSYVKKISFFLGANPIC